VIIEMKNIFITIWQQRRWNERNHTTINMHWNKHTYDGTKHNNKIKQQIQESFWT